MSTNIDTEESTEQYFCICAECGREFPVRWEEMPRPFGDRAYPIRHSESGDTTMPTIPNCRGSWKWVEKAYLKDEP